MVSSGASSPFTPKGAEVAISATVLGGQHFLNWTGDVANLADANSAGTTVPIPVSTVSVTANFAEGDTITILSEIVIDKWITLDGNGVVIVSRENHTRIFRLENSDRNIIVIILKIAIVDVESGVDELGGAIYNNG